MTPSHKQDDVEISFPSRLIKDLNWKSLVLGALLAGGGGISTISAFTPKDLEPRVQALEVQGKIAESKAETDRQRLERIEQKLDRLMYLYRGR